MQLPQEGTPEYRLLECALLLLCETEDREGVREKLREAQRQAIERKRWKVKDRTTSLLYAISTENEELIKRTSSSTVRGITCLDGT